MKKKIKVTCKPKKRLECMCNSIEIDYIYTPRNNKEKGNIIFVDFFVSSVDKIPLINEMILNIINDSKNDIYDCVNKINQLKGVMFAEEGCEDDESI